MPKLRDAVKRLRDRWLLPPSGTVTVTDLIQRFQPLRPGSLRSLLSKMNMVADVAEPIGGSTRPYYQRTKPQPQNANAFVIGRVDLQSAHLPPYATPDVSGTLPDLVPAANSLFDARAAAAVRAAVGEPIQVGVMPNWPAGSDSHDFNALLERKVYDDGPSPIYLMTAKCLAAMAYKDYFPSDPQWKALRDKVSQAILEAWPGWCGSFGPGVDGLEDVILDPPSGDYDMNEMHILPLIYCYYDELPEAREKLITELLKNGQMQRPNLDPTYTSGGTPNDWRRAGYVDPAGHVDPINPALSLHVDLPETENHVLMIATARYLTNQLLYQRSHDPIYDNRRNGDSEDSRPNCMDHLLYLLRAMLIDDFGEYNSKPYQAQTRRALTNLCSFAYDHEVRLAARIVLDYLSARYVTSSNDLRRLVPFRRRNEGDNINRFGFEDAFMAVGTLGGGESALQSGADPMSPYFALLAGNTRAYQPTHGGWAIDVNSGGDMTVEALCSYRLPSSIHDLFVNDQHRRFFQRLHRTDRNLDTMKQRNCDNKEIYASSPSYLISAGGRPATWVIPGQLVFGFEDQNIGVAVTTSFMPTGVPGHLNHMLAKDLIQFGRFSNTPDHADDYGSENYGVAPDFAAGDLISLPAWVYALKDPPNAPLGSFYFVNKRGTTDNPPGFYLAIYQQDDFAMMEAFDTWLHPEVKYEQFKARVRAANGNRGFACNQECVYTTQNGNEVHFIVWNDGNTDDHHEGAKITHIEYGSGNVPNTLPNASRFDTLVDAGQDEDRFLSGTIIANSEDGLVAITNPYLKTTITLDVRDQGRPRRISENGELEMSFDDNGLPHEVWVDFGWKGPSEGDFYRPFKTITAAAAAVADGGVIKIMPGWTNEKPILANKRMRLVAPIGGVAFGVR
jgi:hypothetical protein